MLNVTMKLYLFLYIDIYKYTIYIYNAKLKLAGGKEKNS